jgi:hypothetical protein
MIEFWLVKHNGGCVRHSNLTLAFSSSSLLSSCTWCSWFSPDSHLLSKPNSPSFVLLVHGGRHICHSPEPWSVGCIPQSDLTFWGFDYLFNGFFFSDLNSPSFKHFAIVADTSASAVWWNFWLFYKFSLFHLPLTFSPQDSLIFSVCSSIGVTWFPQAAPCSRCHVTGNHVSLGI